MYACNFIRGVDLCIYNSQNTQCILKGQKVNSLVETLRQSFFLTFFCPPVPHSSFSSNTNLCHGLCQCPPSLMQLWTGPNLAFVIGSLSSARIGGVSPGQGQSQANGEKKAGLSVLLLIFATAVNGCPAVPRCLWVN